MEEKKKDRHFKVPHAFTILFLMLFIAAILTYVLKAGSYDYVDGLPVAGTYHAVDANPQGLWDVIRAPVEGFYSAIEIIVFVLIVGGFLGIVFETKAVDSALGSLIRKLNGREKYLIPVLMLFFAIGGTTYGMSEETIALYPIIIPLVLAAGYDVVTAVMIIFIGCYTGTAASIIDPFSVGLASDLAEVSIGDGIGFRFVFFVAAVGWAMTATMRYAEKVKADPSKSVTADLNEKITGKFKKFDPDELIEMTGKRKVVLGIFGLVFLIMIISLVPWQYKFGIDLFADIHAFLTGIPVIKAILGSMLPFGDWYFVEMSVLFLSAAIFIGIYYRFSQEEIIDIFINGAKDLLGVAMMIGAAKGISVILNDGMIIGTILHAGEVLLSHANKTLFAIGTYLLYIPLTVVVPSTTAVATASMPIIAPLADFIGLGREVVVMAYLAGSNTMCFMSPVCAVLVGSLAIAGVPFTRWLKAVRPFILGMLVLAVIFLTIVTVIG